VFFTFTIRHIDTIRTHLYSQNKKGFSPILLILFVLLLVLCVVMVFAVSIFERDLKNEKFMEQLYSRIKMSKYDMDIIGEKPEIDIPKIGLVYTRVPHKSTEFHTKHPKTQNHRLARPRY